MECLIRKAVKTDAEAILEITKQAFNLYRQALKDPNIPVAALKENLESTLKDITENNVLVGEQNGEIAGSIRWEKLSGDIAYIYRFGVNPEINNTGIGSELLSAAISEIREQGFKLIALHTNTKYYKLARYYYGKEFYVHSTDNSRGYIRALFLKDLYDDSDVDLTPAFNH